MLPLGHGEGEQPARLQLRHGLALQRFIVALEDREQSEERYVQAVGVGRAEVARDFPEAGELQEVKLVASRRIRLGRQDGRVQPVPRLVVDPVRVPPFRPVLLLERSHAFGDKEFREAPSGGVRQILRGA